MPDFMHANHLAAAKGTYEPIRKAHGLIEIALDNADDQELIRLALVSFSLPKTSNEVIEMRYLNEKRKVAGSAVFEDIEFVVRDMMDNDVRGAVRRWREQVYDPITGKVGLARDYKKEARLISFGPDGSNELEWQAIGVFPPGTDWGDHDFEADEDNKITVTLSVDKCVPRFGGTSATDVSEAASDLAA